MLAMGRRQMCPNFSMLLIFANAVYKDGCFSLPNRVWSGGSSLQYHTWDVSYRLKSEPPFPGQPWPGPTEALEIYIAVPREDHLATLEAALMCSKWCCIQIFETRMTFSKQYFEKQGWGQRLKTKEQASVHPLICICSTWKGTISSVDKNRQFLRGNVQLVSWAGSVVFVVELIHRQHGLQQGGFHTECQLVLQKLWHSVWS